MKDFRKTKSVRLLLDEFGQSNEALSVVQLVKAFQIQMNKTTVYRILERLEENGLLHSFTGKDGLKWYAKYNPSESSEVIVDHPHFQCQECGKSECLSLHLTLPAIPNYKVVSSNLLLTGQCKDCLS